MDNIENGIINKWIDFQTSIEINHKIRIPIKDGIENDIYGEFARKFSVDNSNKFIFRNTEYLIAHIIRALKYSIRANIHNLTYQPHMLRRNFALLTDIYDSNSQDDVNVVISYVKNILNTVKDNSDDIKIPKEKINLLILEVPFLGGKLWTEKEIEKYKNCWHEFIVDRIIEYKEKAAIIRNKISKINNDNDLYYINAEIREIIPDLMNTIKVKNHSLTDERSIELGLTCGNSTLTPFTKFSATYTYKKENKLFSGKTPLQKFLLKEYKEAWKRITKKYLM